MADRLRDGDLDQGALSDRLVTPERSVFGTRLPRPTGVGRHLLVVILLSMIALGIAILFAERSTEEAGSSKTRFTRPTR